MLTYRKTTLEDVKIYFDWANDIDVREQSFESKKIDFVSHTKWFNSKINDKSCFMLIFQNENNENVGQLRIQEYDLENAIIGVSIDTPFRGNGFAKEMLVNGCKSYFNHKSDVMIHAYIKKKNISSKFAFENARFQFLEIIDFEGHETYHYSLKK